MLRAMSLLLALVGSAPVFASVLQLRAEAAAHTGVPVRVDERLTIAGCPSGFSFQTLPSYPDRLQASCPDNGWNMVLSLASGPATPLPRRGQVLRVMLEGAGYRASVEAVVESAHARDGTVMLRNARSGSRFSGRVQADGQITAFQSSGR